MSLRPIRSTTVDFPPIPRLLDDPRYAAAVDLQGKFERRIQLLGKLRTQLLLEHSLSTKSVDPKSTSDAQSRWLLRQLQAETLELSAEAQPTANVPPGTSPALARGLRLLAGGTATPQPDLAERLTEIDRQVSELTDARVEQIQIVEAIAVELTYKFAKILQPAWDALQLQFYRDAQQLARTTRRVMELRAEVTAAGLRPRSNILRTPAVRSPLILGDESHRDSEISGWRRLLEEWGILQ